MTEYFNRHDQKARRSRLRTGMPSAEVRLWSRLRGKQILACKFRRQYSVGPYCLDFYCVEQKLAIELDGDFHFRPGAKEKDIERQRWVESFGIRFLRFINTDIEENLDGVIEVIAEEIRKSTGH